LLATIATSGQRRRSEAQADYETFLRGHRVVFPGRVTVQPALEIPSVDRRVFGEYLQPASNPMPMPQIP